jgi:DNA-binding CsgD family transcriptional regulator
MRIASAITAGIGILLLALSIYFDGKINFALPLVFLTLGMAFTFMVFTFRRYWAWSSIFFIPGMLLLVLGIIFLLNVITNDWNSWAYAWLLILTGIGVGTALAAQSIGWRKEILQASVGVAILGTTLFAVFGVIAGGKVIQIMAPILLIFLGVSLRWLRPEQILPETLLQKYKSAGRLPTTADDMEQETTPPNHLLVEPLSAREIEVLQMIEQGLSNQEIATRLVVAQSTVKTHINNIYGKLGVQTRIQAVNEARKNHIL